MFLESDSEYSIDATSVIGVLVRENKLNAYKVFTYGPTYQHATYLYFHLLLND